VLEVYRATTASRRSAAAKGSLRTSTTAGVRDFLTPARSSPRKIFRAIGFSKRSRLTHGQTPLFPVVLISITSVIGWRLSPGRGSGGNSAVLSQKEAYVAYPSPSITTFGCTSRVGANLSKVTR